MKTLILDNFDSFTYNLYQYCAELGGNPEVVRNNAITVEKIAREKYTHIIISPGPGTPEKKKDFGVCADVIQKFAGKIPILGVCLGHQGIISVFGGKVIRAPVPVHGKRSKMRILKRLSFDLFKGLPNEFEAMRYHSLIVDRNSVPKDFVITAETTADKLVMSVAHKIFPLFGVQFHPESIGTPLGKQILRNFLVIASTHERSECAFTATSRRMAGQHGAQRKPCKTKQSPSPMSEKEAEKLLDQMASGKLSESKMSKILLNLAEKGESVSEIVGMARAMRRCAVKLPLKSVSDLMDTPPRRGTSKVGSSLFGLMDTCGTGGSGLPRMNISTTAAFVLAEGGVKIAKHGNRSAGGRCGSFDLLETLGVNIQLSPRAVARAIKEIGIGFLFAPMFHPAMKRIAPVRKKLGIRTIFNLLGPLTNPAEPQYHLLGTTSKEIAEKLISAMKELKYKHAIITVGEDGLDDVTLTGKTKIFEFKNGKISQYDFSPEQIGMASVKDFKAISGGNAQENAKIFEKLLKGTAPTPLQNLLLLNCAFGFLARDKVKTIKNGLKMAERLINSGKAYKKFLEYKTFSNSFERFKRAIRGKDKISVIAEVKLKSPSFGDFPKHNLKKLIKDYEKGGASAISVVTEPKLFNGSLALLKKVRRLTKLPIIRKDFIKTTEQIDESLRAGANAVLLISRILDKKSLERLAEYAQKKGIDPVVEIHDPSDLKKITGINGAIVGINNRNLVNFKTDVNHAKRYLNKLNPNLTVIAESAFKNAGELKQYAGKIDAVLIGTALLTSKNPLKTLTSFTNRPSRRGEAKPLMRPKGATLCLSYLTTTRQKKMCKA